MEKKVPITTKKSTTKPTETIEKKENLQMEEKKITESRKTVCENVIIKNVSSPSTIQRIATEKGINPQEVYVRVTFEYKGNDFTASNKLRFLGKSGYEELLNAMKNKTPMRFVVDIDKGFFYVENDVSIDSLFAQEVERKDTRKQLSDLL